ncbi:MAG TPA: PTS sugar transporter subunit IIA [Gemmatimonadaceae bacterium]
MKLSVREAATHLGVDEATVRRWINQRGLPVHQVSERLYLNPVELWEWAVENGIPVSRKLLDEARTADEVGPLHTLLRAGGVFHDLPGASKAEVLRAIVDRLPLPPEQDREFLLGVLEAREAMGSTGVGDGIAIPHVRNPIVLHIEQPFVTLCLLRNPVDFGAVDGQPVYALFIVVSPTVPAHLKILARLGFVLRDDELRRLLRAGAPAADIVDRVELIETSRNTGSFQAVPRP